MDWSDYIRRLMQDGRERSGYQLLRVCRDDNETTLSPSPNDLYKALYRLEAAAVLEVDYRPVHNRLRKYYRVPVGKTAARRELLRLMPHELGGIY